MIKKIIFLIFISITTFAAQTKVLEVLKLSEESFELLGENEDSSYLLLENNSLWLLEIPYIEATLLFKKGDSIEIGKTSQHHFFETDEDEILYAKELITKNFENPFLAFEIGSKDKEELKKFDIENIKMDFSLFDFIQSDDDSIEIEYDEDPNGSLLIVDEKIITLDFNTWEKGDKIFKAYVQSPDGNLLIFINLTKKEILSETLNVAILAENIKTIEIENISNISYGDFEGTKIGFIDILLKDDSKWTTLDLKNEALNNNLKFKKIVFTLSPIIIEFLDEISQFLKTTKDMDIKNKKFIILQDKDKIYPLIFGWEKI
jgi:hypothetical protein